MKSFKQFIVETPSSFYQLEKANWSEHDHELWKDKKHLRPAIKLNYHPHTLYVGKVGDTHQDIKEKHNLSGISQKDGMYHTKKKEFHPSAIDSTDLMSDSQRMRKFGTFEE